MIKEKGIVNIVKAHNYSKEILKKELSRFKLGNLLKNQKHLLIKPNICGGIWGEDHTQTSFSLLKNLIKIIREYNKEIKIGIIESDCTWWDYDQILIDSEYLKLLNFENVFFINLSEGDRTEVDLKLFGKVKVSNALLRGYPLINLPKVKTHVLCKISVGIKNLFGLMPIKNKVFTYHLNPFFRKSLFEIADYFTPILNIYDGIISCKGSCPLLGDPIKTNFFIITDNLFAGDIETAKIIGVEPNEVPYIKYGLERMEIKYGLFGDVAVKEWEHSSFFGTISSVNALKKIRKIKKKLNKKERIATFSDFNQRTLKSGTYIL